MVIPIFSFVVVDLRKADYRRSVCGVGFPAPWWV